MLDKTTRKSIENILTQHIPGLAEIILTKLAHAREQIQAGSPERLDQLIKDSHWCGPLVIYCHLLAASYSKIPEERVSRVYKALELLQKQIRESTKTCIDIIKLFDGDQDLVNILHSEILVLRWDCNNAHPISYLDDLFESLKPKYSTQQVTELIHHFLNSVSKNYIQSLKHHDPMKNQLLCGSKLELDYMSSHLDLCFVIHHGNQQTSIGGINKYQMHLELYRTNRGLFMFNLLIGMNNRQTIAIPEGENNLFHAVLLGLSYKKNGKPSRPIDLVDIWQFRHDLAKFLRERCKAERSSKGADVIRTAFQKMVYEYGNDGFWSLSKNYDLPFLSLSYLDEDAYELREQRQKALDREEKIRNKSFETLFFPPLPEENAKNTRDISMRESQVKAMMKSLDDATAQMQEGNRPQGEQQLEMLLNQFNAYPPFFIFCQLLIANYGLKPQKRIANVFDMLKEQAREGSAEIFIACIETIKLFSGEKELIKLLHPELLTIDCGYSASKKELLDNLCTSLKPEQSLSQLIEEINTFLHDVPKKYTAALINHDRDKGEVIRGADLELNGIARLWDLCFFIHRQDSEIPTAVYSIGDQTKQRIDLERSNNSAGFKHYNLKLMHYDKNAELIRIPDDENNLFKAVILGKSYLRRQPIPAATESDISGLRRDLAFFNTIAESNQDAIREQFTNLVYADKHSIYAEINFEAVCSRLSDCALRKEAIGLNQQWMEAQARNRKPADPISNSLPVLYRFSLFETPTNPVLSEGVGRENTLSGYMMSPEDLLTILAWQKKFYALKHGTIRGFFSLFNVSLHLGEHSIDDAFDDDSIVNLSLTSKKIHGAGSEEVEKFLTSSNGSVASVP